MPKENNKMQIDIENLFKQNVNDLSAIKELYRKLKEVEEKITQIKYNDSTLANKLKKEYEKLKKIILDENIQFKLTNDIETIISQMDNMKNKTVYYTNIKDYEHMVINHDWSPVIAYCEELGKPLKFPKGEYLIKSYLTKKNGIDWFGDGEESIIKIDNTFEYLNNNKIAIKNENYNNSNNIYDSFKFSDLTFKYCITDENKPVYFSTFMSTKNVIIDNCYFDSSDTNLIIHITMDFKGDNQNTIIRNCTCVYNTNATTHEGNTICFRNFSNKTSNGITITNNVLKRLSGGDEIIWVCANVGDIENITIRDNKLSSLSDNPHTSGIYILQTDTNLGGTQNVKNITIENNTIDIKNLKYSAIKIGSGLESTPYIMNVNIRNNKINVTTSDLTTSCAIQTTRCNNSFVQENIINGVFWRGITNVKVCEKNIINITDDDGCIVNCDYVSKNEIVTTNKGLKNCINAFDNKISCKNIELSKNVYFNYKNNTINAISNESRLFLITGNIADNENLKKPVLTLESNIIYNGLGVIDYNLEYAILINNIAYINASGFAIEPEIIKFANNNTIIKSDGTVINDTRMNLLDANAIPYNFRLNLPLGHKILSLTDFKNYTKTKTGDSATAWIKED